MVNSAPGKRRCKNLINQLLIFLNGMGFCTPFLENGKTVSEKTHFRLILYIKQVLFRFHHGVFKDTCFYNIFKVKVSQIYETFVKKILNLQQQTQRYWQNSRLRKIIGQEYISWQVNVHWDTKTRIFQFKILNNVLYLNKQL